MYLWSFVQLQRTRPSARSAQRARRQRIFNRAVLGATLVIIVIVSVYALYRPPGVVLPDYLTRCVPLKGALVYSSSFSIKILVRGSNSTVPAGIGIDGTCVKPIHTFSPAGTVHIDTNENRTYTLKDFFLLWGIKYGAIYANFDKDQLFNLHGPTILKVNNQTDPRFENYPLPTGGSTIQNAVISISYG